MAGHQGCKSTLERTLEAKPSHVMHRQWYFQLMKLYMLLLVRVPDIVLEKGSKHMIYLSQMMVLCRLISSIP